LGLEQFNFDSDSSSCESSLRLVQLSFDFDRALAHPRGSNTVFLTQFEQCADSFAADAAASARTTKTAYWRL
jgi:hypothetical protein